MARQGRNKKYTKSICSIGITDKPEGASNIFFESYYLKIKYRDAPCLLLIPNALVCAFFGPAVYTIPTFLSNFCAAFSTCYRVGV